MGQHQALSARVRKKNFILKGLTSYEKNTKIFCNFSMYDPYFSSICCSMLCQ